MCQLTSGVNDEELISSLLILFSFSAFVLGAIAGKMLIHNKNTSGGTALWTSSDGVSA